MSTEDNVMVVKLEGMMLIGVLEDGVVMTQPRVIMRSQEGKLVLQELLGKPTTVYLGESRPIAWLAKDPALLSMYREEISGIVLVDPGFTPDNLIQMRRP